MHVRVACALLFGAVLLRCSPFEGGETAAPAADGGSDAADAALVPGAAAAGEASVFAADQHDVTSLVASGDTLYWAARGDGAVRSCKLAGCAAPTDVVVGGRPVSVAWSTRLLWADETKSAVFFLADGGKPGQIALTDVPRSVVADSGGVYALSGRIVRLVGDPPYSVTSFVPFDSGPTRAAVNDGVAWVTADVVRFCADPGSCTDAASVVASVQQPTAVALDDAQIFWATVDGHLRARERRGGTVLDLASSLADPRGIAASSTSAHVYVTVGGTAAASYGDGSVVKVPRGGGAAVVLAKDQARPGPIVIAGGSVFWANTLDGTIRRAPM